MVENAFTTVRPRGPDLDIPAAAPRKTNTSKAPMGNVHLLLDSKGNRTVSLAPRAKGGISIETRAQSQASVDKRKRISKAGTK